MRAFWVISLAAALAGTVLGCDKKKDSDDGASEKKTSKGDDEEEAPRPKLPAGFPDKPSEKALRSAAKWATKKPEAIEAIKGLRMPTGCEGKATAIDTVTFYTCQYQDVTMEKALLGWLVLLAEDGWTISSFKRTNDRPTFDIRKGDTQWGSLVGAPKGKEDSTPNLTVVYGLGGKGLPAGKRELIGLRVKATWPKDGKAYGGKITRTYGKFGFVVFDDGSAEWEELEKMSPPQENDFEPSDDDCEFKVGDKVRAPWSSARSNLYRGKLDKAYKRLLHVKFDDGDVGWAECGEIKKP